MVKKKSVRLLTELELEIMNAVWARGECTVKEVQDALSSTRELAYTSVATVMKILQDKGVLQSKRGEKALAYKPVLSRADYEVRTLQHVTDNVFQGSPTSFVARLLEEADLSSDDLLAIRKLLNERLRS